jgi:hypothetical protein
MQSRKFTLNCKPQVRVAAAAQQRGKSFADEIEVNFGRIRIAFRFATAIDYPP